MKYLIPGCCVVLALATVSKAQVPPVDPAPRQQIQKRVERLRQAMRKGLVIRTNVRVVVRLRNGNKIKGVVRNGRFIEKVSGLQFVDADMQAIGAGLRVWYYDNTTSYIFLPFEEIKTYKIGRKLTDVQVKAIAKRIEQARARAAEKRRQLLAAKEEAEAQQGEGEDPEDPSVPVGKKTAKGKGKSAEQKAREAKLLALVAEFPPEQGWNEKKIREIQLRKITVGAFPGPKESRFIEVFKDWQEGLRLAQLKKLEQAEAKESNSGSTPPPAPSKGGGSKGGAGK